MYGNTYLGVGINFSESKQGSIPVIFLGKSSWWEMYAAAKSLQSCPTLCNPVDGSPPGSPVPGILQAGTLEWVSISFSNAWKWKVKVKSPSRVRLFATPWTAAHQAPPSMGFSRQECWSGVPLPSPRKCMRERKIFNFYPWDCLNVKTTFMFYFLVFLTMSQYVIYIME